MVLVEILAEGIRACSTIHLKLALWPLGHKPKLGAEDVDYIEKFILVATPPAQVRTNAEAGGALAQPKTK
jgi:hypothetical protein